MGIKARYGNGYHLDLLLTVKTEAEVAAEGVSAKANDTEDGGVGLLKS